MLAILFWIAVGCVLHTYVIYPLLLVALDAIGQARGAWGYLGGNERRRPAAQLRTLERDAHPRAVGLGRGGAPGHVRRRSGRSGGASAEGQGGQRERGTGEGGGTPAH
jgi:hypothetical protein